MDDLGHDHGDDGSATLATVARQPILDTAWDVIGFELLYRAAVDDGPRSPEAMTANVIVTGFSDIGLTELVSSRPAYLNVTRSFLLGMRPWHLPHDRIVLELEEGFALALDDFRYRPELEPLLDIAGVVKLDVRALSRWELIDGVERVEGRDLRLVAEKVETAEEYQFCRELGFDAYQGFFFARPDLVRRRRAPTRELGTLSALTSAGASASFEELEAIITRDAGMPRPVRPSSGRHQDNAGLETLTARELEVLGCLASGARTRAIAEHLGIAEPTVKRHLTNLVPQTRRDQPGRSRHQVPAPPAGTRS